MGIQRNSKSFQKGFGGVSDDLWRIQGLPGGLRKFLGCFNGVLEVLDGFRGFLKEFEVVSKQFHEASETFQMVSRAFQGSSRGAPGAFRGIAGVFKEISGVFQVILVVSGAHSCLNQFLGALQRY